MSSKRNQSGKNKTQTARREPIPWRYFLLTLGCALALVVGFFFAARSHFASIDFGIKNSKLRKQIEELESDKRRLILAKEIALSPAEIKKAAKKIGLTEMTAANIETYRPAATVVNTAKDKLNTLIEKPRKAFLGETDEPKKEDAKLAKDALANKRFPEAKEKKDKPATQIARK